jgi:hypothetical protein
LAGNNRQVMKKIKSVCDKGKGKGEEEEIVGG